MVRVLTDKLDQRVQRSRQLLQTALIELMVEKGYDHITVQQILDRAKIGRATFYAHFRDKEALFCSTIDNLRSGIIRGWDELLSSAGKGRGELDFALGFFKHVSQSRDIYHAVVCSDAGPIVNRQFRRMFADLARADLSAAAKTCTALQMEATVQFVVGSLMSLMTWWMDYEVKLSAEEINEIFLRATLPGVRSLQTGKPVLKSSNVSYSDIEEIN